MTSSKLVSTIKDANDLDDLLEALRAFQATLPSGEDCDDALSAIGIDLADLPHYGDRPWPIKYTPDLRSWDDDRVLIGTGPVTDWRVVDRTEWEQGYVVTDRHGSAYFDGRAFDSCEEAGKAAKGIPEKERPYGVWICRADGNTTQDVEIYEPTLSPEALAASDARDSALEHMAQAAVDAWENYAEEGQVMDRRKLAEALDNVLPSHTVQTWEVFLKKVKPRTVEDRVKELEEELELWRAVLRGPATQQKVRPVWPAPLSKTKPRRVVAGPLGGVGGASSPK